MEEERKKYTLRIDGWSSTCMNCGKNCDPEEKTHTKVLGWNEEERRKSGCGIEWKYKIGGYDIGNSILTMRPDLKQVDFFTYKDFNPTKD